MLGASEIKLVLIGCYWGHIWLTFNQIIQILLYKLVFPSGALGYIAYSFPVGYSVDDDDTG